MRLNPEIYFGLRLANDGAVAAGAPEGVGISFDWLTDFLKGILDPQTVVDIVKQAIADWKAKLDANVFLKEVWEKIAAGDWGALKNWGLGKCKELSDGIMAGLKAAAAKTKIPWDDSVVAAVAAMFDSFWAGQLPVTPVQPKPLLSATAEETDWNDRFDRMSEQEQEDEIKRLIAERTGTTGIISTVLIGLLINIASRWGLEMVQKLIDRWFKPARPAIA